MAVAAPPQVLTRTLAAPAAEVYKFFTQQDWLTCWLADGAHTNPKVGGHFVLTWADHSYVLGSFTTLVENQVVGFTWREGGETHDSYVTVTLDAQDDQTAVTIQHEDASDPALYEREWNKSLNTLATVFETGADRRVTDRVILGIYPDTELSQELADAIGIKRSDGARIANLVPGYGAEKAGLHKGDVILEVAGEKVDQNTTLQKITSQYGAGDVVTVQYYRDGERHTAQMPLTGYPIPAIPDDYAGLVEQLHQINSAISAELDALFANVTAAEATHKPAPKEWNAQEVLAHLILNERWLHGWIGGWMQGGFSHGYAGNTEARIIGITHTYADTAALIAELKRCWAETEAILEHIPAEFAGNKTMRWWLAFEVLQQAPHTHEHFEQIQAAIAHARA